MSTSPQETTELLRRSRRGDAAARTALFARLYEPLRDLAHGQLRPRRGATLDTTELVHEAYVKLVGAESLSPADRSHFFAISARVMRQILVDRFRKTGAEKRGGDAQRIVLEAGRLPAEEPGPVLLALDEALDRLASFDERAARIVELKFFGGMTEPEIAEAVEVSVRTVSGDWRKARAWLARELEPT